MFQIRLFLFKKDGGGVHRGYWSLRYMFMMERLRGGGVIQGDTGVWDIYSRSGYSYSRMEGRRGNTGDTGVWDICCFDVPDQVMLIFLYFFNKLNNSFKDAKWETEGEAFNDLLLRPDTCDALVCKCPGGRK